MIILITVIVLVALFVFQRGGTSRVGLVFGPIMAVWFMVIGILGALAILHYPQCWWLLILAMPLRFHLPSRSCRHRGAGRRVPVRHRR